MFLNAEQLSLLVTSYIIHDGIAQQRKQQLYVTYTGHVLSIATGLSAQSTIT